MMTTKYSYHERKAMWLAAMDAWKQRTENYRNYSMAKAMHLDKKYKIDRRGMLSIKKSHRKRHTTIANKQLRTRTT